MDRLAICELESRRRALPERRSNDIAERIFGWLEEVLDGSARKIPILADGTVRTGFDVLKIRALGADVALIGRPLAQVCIGG